MSTKTLLGDKKILLTFSAFILGFIIFLINYDGISRYEFQQLNRAVRKDFGQKHVYIIARAHKGLPRRQVQAFVHSLLAQTHKHFTLWIVNGDDPSKRVFSDEMSGFEDNRVSSVSFRFKMSKNFSHSFGYHTTDLALEKIISIIQSEDRNQFLLVTNSDNLYHSQFLETSLNMVDEGACFVASNWISRFPLSRKNIANQAEKVYFENGGIDLGCVLSSLYHVRRTFNSGPYFIKNEMAADWLFFERIMKTFGMDCVKKTEQVLFIHQ